MFFKVFLFTVNYDQVHGILYFKKKNSKKELEIICPVDELYNPLKTIQNVMNNKYVDIWYKEKKWIYYMYLKTGYIKTHKT